MIKKEDAWFSNTDEGVGVLYSHAQKLDLNNDQDLIEGINLLRNRLKAILINQSEILNSKNGETYHGASFPLAVMTCIGIETLGRIFFKENKDDTSHQFVEGIKLVDQKFGRKLKKNDKKELIAVWGERFTDTNISLIGGLVHSYFRNTMIHGYRGRGVFLSFQQDTLMLLQDGYLILNPNLFWNSFVNAFNKEFNSIIEDGKINQQNIKVKAIKAYLHELIHK